MGTDITQYADKAMFEAEPMERHDSGHVLPRVRLLWATPDPMGAIAAACRMYEGKATRSMDDITDDERRHYFNQSLKTHLKAPWEFVQFHFFIEGVTRAFTHQMVRQRTAVYAQESLRFAVKDNMADEIALPPSLMDGSSHDDLLQIYRGAVKTVEQAYNTLVANGIPAEDARHLLPHGVTTRLNYNTNLRGLVEHSGNRLCTQAQFEWRHVFIQILEAIRDYNPGHAFGIPSMMSVSNAWQFEAIAKSGMFAPICYKTGKCEFKASFDRGCTIRDRVDQNAASGRPSSEWGHDKVDHHPSADRGDVLIGAIHPAEWLADHRAGITHDKHGSE